MRITITGRHFELSEALKSHVEEKLSKFDRFSVRIPEVHVKLDVEKYRHIAEVILHVNHSVLTSKEESQDMYVSVDGAIDKMERMLRRYKTRWSPKPSKSPQDRYGPVEEESSVEEEFAEEY
jgi:putative sigma-54 modulation protein